MKTDKKMFVTFLVIILNDLAIANDTCTNIHISILDLVDHENVLEYNFTKQISNINDRPFYYSLNQEVIWWNVQESCWIGQSFYEQDVNDFVLIFQINENVYNLDVLDGKNWKMSWKGKERLISLRCFTLSRKCLAQDTNNHTIDYKNSHPVKFKGTANGECVFPFEYEGKNYYGCTNTGDSKGKYWCATWGKKRITKEGGTGQVSSFVVAQVSTFYIVSKDLDSRFGINLMF